MKAFEVDAQCTQLIFNFYSKASIALLHIPVHGPRHAATTVIIGSYQTIFTELGELRGQAPKNKDAVLQVYRTHIGSLRRQLGMKLTRFNEPPSSLLADLFKFH